MKILKVYRQKSCFLTNFAKRCFSVEESKWKSGIDFDREKFERDFTMMKPEKNEHFDKQMKVYGLNDGQFLINHYWINGSVIIFP